MINHLIRTFGLFAALAILASEAAAFPFSYGGRLTESSGKPLVGPVDLTLKFYAVPTNGSPLFSKPFTDVPLSQGTFSVHFDMDPTSVDLLFGDPSAAAYVEVFAHGKTYQRQQFAMVPYAMRVPVDGKTLAFDDTTGALKLNAGNVTPGFYLKGGAGGTISWAPGGTGNGDMEAATYDNSGSAANGIVDEAEDAQRLGGQLPAHYAVATHNHDAAYAPLAHNHDAAYAALSHNHNATYSLLGHTHTKADVGLGSVENTALSTWSGSANLTTLGTIGTGTWQGTPLADSYIASAAAWNANNAKVSSQWTTNASHIHFNTGRVGIGTASPGAPLEVKMASGSDALYVSRTQVANDDGSYLAFRAGASGTTIRGIIGSTHTGTLPAGTMWPGELADAFGLAAANALHLGVQSQSAPSLTIASSGAVGIGTTGPVGVIDAWGTGAKRLMSLEQRDGVNGAVLSFYRTTDNARHGSIGFVDNFAGLSVVDGGLSIEAGELRSEVPVNVGSYQPLSLSGELRSYANSDLVVRPQAGYHTVFAAGNVGIGSASPAASLDVAGTVKLSAAGTPAAGKVLTSDASGNATWQVAPGATPTYANLAALPASPANGELAYVTSNTCTYSYSTSNSRWEVLQCDYYPSWRVNAAAQNTLTYYDQGGTGRDVAVTALTAGVTRNYLYGISYAGTTHTLNGSTPAASDAMAIHEGAAASDDGNAPSRIRGRWQRCGYTIGSRPVCLPYLGMVRDLGVANGNFEAAWARVGRTTTIAAFTASTATGAGPTDVDITAYTTKATTVAKLTSNFESPGSAGNRAFYLGACGSPSLAFVGNAYHGGTWAAYGQGSLDIVMVPGCAAFTRAYRYSASGALNVHSDVLYAYEEDP